MSEAITSAFSAISPSDSPPPDRGIYSFYTDASEFWLSPQDIADRDQATKKDRYDDAPRVDRMARKTRSSSIGAVRKGWRAVPMTPCTKDLK
jgi:hypothetical protein